MADSADRFSDDTNVALIRDGVAAYLNDNDPEETQEWLESLDGLLEEAGPERARFLMLRLLERATAKRVPLPSLTSTDYVNTIPTSIEPEFPGDEDIERRYRKWMRWNAAVMVHRAQRPGVGVGGHISSYASSAPLYEVGFNHFFRGKDHAGGGDQIFYQGHASPGMYARAFLEGRLSEHDLDAFRQEVSQERGLPSYPHPHGLPDFWEFPTVSMGLGPMNAIYQARFNKYINDRGIKDTTDQHVWAFLGDGEMDEPESRGLLQIAALNKLDNLTFVVNCNLQRLDGPVRGNGQIIQELESFFRGAGWNVIKVVWGREWDKLIEADKEGALVDLMNRTSDGDYQTFKANDGAFVREHFFNRDPRVAKLIEIWSDEELWELRRGGHDYRKIYAAYKAALETKGQPTVILAHTVKGYGLGHNFEGRNATHQMKKLTLDDLKQFRDKQDIPITDEELDKDPYLPPYYNPGEDAEEIRYLKERRRELGGALPARRVEYSPLTVPATEDVMKSLLKGAGKQGVATTMALVRALREMLKVDGIGDRIVPIIPDEARTFGLDSWFSTLKIYNPLGQNYTPVDADLMLSYRESTEGQILHEGISEAGSMGSFAAVGSSYATHGEVMIPVYIFYSMFGFQRTGDSMWAAADQLTRGFLVGATAGRTTLTGEGLQHMDGHSPVLAATNPSVVSYDPAFGYEVAHLVREGIDRMYGEGRGENVIYYLTVYNEPTPQPAQPENLDIEGLHKGIYPFEVTEGENHVNLLASGIGMQAALKARDILAEDYKIPSSIYSVTSWNELARDGLSRETEALRNPGEFIERPYVQRVLEDADGPFIAVTDYMKALPEQIRQWVPGDYTTLGCDGFGFSDTREAARRYFNTDAESVVVAALAGLAREGKIDKSLAADAAKRFEISDPRAVAVAPIEHSPVAE